MISCFDGGGALAATPQAWGFSGFAPTEFHSSISAARCRSRLNAAMAATATSLPPGAPEESLEKVGCENLKKQKKEVAKKEASSNLQKKFFADFR